MIGRFRLVVLCLAALIGVGIVYGLKASAATSGDAYATQGVNACTWTMGTAGIEKVVTFSGGNYQLTSFKNKLTSPVREYVQGTQSSSEFRFTWDGTMYTGSSGGWTCNAGSSSTVTVGGG